MLKRVKVNNDAGLLNVYVDHLFINNTSFNEQGIYKFKDIFIEDQKSLIKFDVVKHLSSKLTIVKDSIINLNTNT